MNLASIDIGTNSTRLLITNFTDNIFKTLIRLMEITRLGKGVGESGYISKENAKLTINVLKKYRKLIDEFGVDSYKAVGTSALRQAKNNNDFIKQVLNETAIKIDVISAKEEAKYSFNGTLKSLIAANKIIVPGKLLVIDIGGGSSEFIFGGKDCVFFKSTSINIGCVGATENFLRSDPPTTKEITSLRSMIKDKLKKELVNYFEKYKGEFIIVGLAGTVSSLAGISIGLKNYHMEKLNYLTLSLNEITDIFDRLCRSSLMQRKKILGFDPKRADVIIGGTVILLEVMDYFKKDEIIVSENDILDGIIYSLINF